MEEEIGKLDFIKIKNSVKDTVKKMIKQDKEKIFAKYISDKELTSKICKAPLKSIITKQMAQLNTWPNILRHFTRDSK